MGQHPPKQEGEKSRRHLGLDVCGNADKDCSPGLVGLEVCFTGRERGQHGFVGGYLAQARCHSTLSREVESPENNASCKGVLKSLH